MRKDALTITLTTLVLGIFGAFLRWLQNMNLYDEEGLAARGAGISIVLAVYILISAVVLALIVRLWLRRYVFPADVGAALRCRSVVPAILGWAMAAAFVIASLVLMFSADLAKFPTLQRGGHFSGTLHPRSHPEARIGRAECGGEERLGVSDDLLLLLARVQL